MEQHLDFKRVTHNLIHFFLHAENVTQAEGRAVQALINVIEAHNKTANHRRGKNKAC